MNYLLFFKISLKQPMTHTVSKMQVNCNQRTSNPVAAVIKFLKYLSKNKRFIGFNIFLS